MNKLVRLAVLAAFLLLAGNVHAQHTVNLTWMPGAGGTPAAAYSLYRSAVSGGEAQALPVNGVSLIAGTAYADPAVVSGQTYYYAVKALTNPSSISVSLTRTVNGKNATITATYTDSSLGVQTVYQLWGDASTNKLLTSGRKTNNTGTAYVITWTGPKMGNDMPIFTVSDSFGFTASTQQQSTFSNEVVAVIPSP